MEHLSNDHKDHLSQRDNSYKPCHETGHTVVNLMENQRKLRLNQNTVSIKQY